MKHRALFLDRDGVINVEGDYVHSSEDFHFHEDIFELCRAAQSLGYVILVITNQAGIGRGYYTEAEFLNLTNWMIDQFAIKGIHIPRVYYCPDHPVHGLGQYRRDSPDRKPKPGMLLRAQSDFGLELSSSILVGDQDCDIEAARAAGIGTKILFKPGFRALDAQVCDYYVSDSLDDIRERFLSNSST